MEGTARCSVCEGGKFQEFDRCPRSQSSPDADLCVQLWGRYKNGHLPYAGGWLDQPPILSEVFALVSSEYEVCEKLRERR